MRSTLPSRRPYECPMLDYTPAVQFTGLGITPSTYANLYSDTWSKTGSQCQRPPRSLTTTTSAFRTRASRKRHRKGPEVSPLLRATRLALQSMLATATGMPPVGHSRLRSEPAPIGGRATPGQTPLDAHVTVWASTRSTRYRKKEQ